MKGSYEADSENSKYTYIFDKLLECDSFAQHTSFVHTIA